MATEYIARELQTVPVGQNVVFPTTVIGCTKGYVLHREGSGIFKLRGVTNQYRARYKVSFGGDIAIPTGQTVGSISIAIAIDGEPVQNMTVTPAAVEQFFNVYGAVFIDVPCGTSSDISVENVSTIPIEVIDANLIIERVA